MSSVLFLLPSRARTADQTLALLGILFLLRRIDDDFCYNLLSLFDTLDDFGVYSVGLTDGYGMGCEGLVAEGPNLILALAIHNLISLPTVSLVGVKRKALLATASTPLRSWV